MELKQQIIEKLKSLQLGDDPESQHWDADGLLCEFLTELGHGDIVAEWNKVVKWYS